LLDDDSGPTSPAYGQLTFEDGLKVWRENVPLADKPYRAFRWGKDLQIWLAEGREFRSPNKSADHPGKTIWGEAQKKWFQETVQASDATFKILFSPTPIVGPDRDAHAQGWDEDDVRPEHRFLRLKGGFLGVKVEREGGTPTIAFTHYDVEGKAVHAEKRNAKVA